MLIYVKISASSCCESYHMIVKENVHSAREEVDLVDEKLP